MASITNFPDELKLKFFELATSTRYENIYRLGGLSTDFWRLSQDRTLWNHHINKFQRKYSHLAISTPEQGSSMAKVRILQELLTGKLKELLFKIDETLVNDCSKILKGQIDVTPQLTKLIDENKFDLVLDLLKFYPSYDTLIIPTKLFECAAVCEDPQLLLSIRKCLEFIIRSHVNLGECFKKLESKMDLSSSLNFQLLCATVNEQHESSPSNQLLASHVIPLFIVTPVKTLKLSDFIKCGLEINLDGKHFFSDVVFTYFKDKEGILSKEELLALHSDLVASLR